MHIVNELLLDMRGFPSNTAKAGRLHSVSNGEALRSCLEGDIPTPKLTTLSKYKVFPDFPYPFGLEGRILGCNYGVS